jgi:protein-tyrosine phosphatase
MIRRIPFQGALNFRDIGGYLAAGGLQTRWRLVYRSDSLHFLSAEDLPVFDALGVRSIYDLRRSSDLRDHPGPRDHIHLELPKRPGNHKEGSGAVVTPRRENWLLAEYRTMLADAAISFGNLFTRLSQDTRLPAVIHCVGGKDRTGLAVAPLLTALGVDRELVLDDYQLTNEYRGTPHLPHVISMFVTAGLGQEAAEAVLSSPRWAMAAALDEVDKTHGGIENYLLGAAGMTAQTLADLKDTLLVRVQGHV